MMWKDMDYGLDFQTLITSTIMKKARYLWLQYNYFLLQIENMNWTELCHKFHRPYHCLAELKLDNGFRRYWRLWTGERWG